MSTLPSFSMQTYGWFSYSFFGCIVSILRRLFVGCMESRSDSVGHDTITQRLIICFSVGCVH